MRIDSHQHFWRYDPAQYGWIRPDTMGVLQRDFLPPDLEAELDAVGLHASVAVQARQSLEESHWLLDLAQSHERVAGVVGWVDLRSESIEEQLAGLARHRKFVGVRHVVQDEPDDDFMLGAAFLRGLGRLRRHGLTYDILIHPRQLPATIELVRRFPEQPFVLDHIAKPGVRDGTISPWRERIRELARAENVFCKVSGMVTEADWGAWTARDIEPFLDVIFEAFGVRRLMFGSDWPVCLCAGSYAAVHGLVADYLKEFTKADQEALFGGNAAAFYGLSEGLHQMGSHPPM